MKPKAYVFDDETRQRARSTVARIRSLGFTGQDNSGVDEIVKVLKDVGNLMEKVIEQKRKID